MPFSLIPTWIADSVSQVTPDFLTENNIRLLMLDFDNTIVPYTTDIPTMEVIEWLESMRKTDTFICIVSNSRKKRVQDFCKRYGFDCITHAQKPFSYGIFKCLERYQVPAERSLLVGDQIYTDTLGGNCAGISTLLVRSIHNHTFWLKLRHVAEMPFILLAQKRRRHL